MKAKKFNFWGIAFLLSFSLGVQAGEKSCISLMAQFLKQAKSLDSRATLQFLPHEKQRLMGLLDHFEATELSASEIDRLSNLLDKHLSSKQMDRFEEFIIYLDSLTEKERELAYSGVEELVSGSAKNKVIKKFFSMQKRVKKAYEKEYAKVARQMRQSGEAYQSEDIMYQASRQASDYVKEYRKVINGCHSKKWTPYRKKAMANFSKFTIGIGMASAATSYTIVNWDRDDISWQRKYGQLGYELATGVVKGWIASKILSNPSSEVLYKGIQKWFVSRITGIADMVGFSLFFSSSNEDVRKELDKVLADPKKKQAIKELIEHLEDEKVWPRYKKAMMRNTRAFAGMIGINIPKKLSYQDVDWENLSEDELNDPQVQDILLAAATAKLYDQKSGDFLVTGNAGWDIWNFHAIYGAMLLPKNLYVNYFLIYKTLCLGVLRPKQALMTALTYYTLNRAIFDRLYYGVRRKAINL